tara:strand:+ start:452 stop:613 length:162 start_codon:yes stop_codon:yes gene_type:complete
MKTYKAVYDAGEYWILAKDSEDAAWIAHDHAVNCGWNLKDVIPNDKEETLFCE